MQDYIFQQFKEVEEKSIKLQRVSSGLHEFNPGL